GKAIQAVQKGEDPALEKQEKKRSQPATFGELAHDYLERYAKVRKRSWKNDELNLRLHILPEWKDRKVEAIKRADVIALVDRAEANKQPHLARQLLAVVRKLFNWAVEKSLADASPADGVRLSGKVQDRSRTLTTEELKELWAVWDQLGDPWGPYFKMLLLTAQRRSEVARMKWDHIEGCLWTIPPEENKSDRLHVVPLSPEVMNILNGLPRTTSPYVFPARGGRSRTDRAAPSPPAAISGFSAAVRKVNRTLVEPIEWRIHDLRRTATSMMAALRFPPHVLGAVLNHAPQATMKGVLSVYNRHQYLDEKREALEAWAAYAIANMKSSGDSTLIASRADG
ncbi:MAG: tyrosine-type recombinase/integrase, partial [Actinobacteria bacterium]|nr:tyrosine-type recombinase/integrase [Actinomycetota bacterium]